MILSSAPNSFTPDGNNVNEVWIPVFSSPDYVDRYNLEIYNRWGELIFATDQVTQGWNGMVDNSGNIAQDGIYTWKLSFKWYDQRTYQLKDILHSREVRRPFEVYIFVDYYDQIIH